MARSGRAGWALSIMAIVMDCDDRVNGGCAQLARVVAIVLPEEMLRVLAAGAVGERAQLLLEWQQRVRRLRIRVPCNHHSRTTMTATKS